MPLKSPKIDNRTFSDILRLILGDQKRAGLRDDYTPEWTSKSPDDPGVVMANLFGRLMEIVIERLNGVPDKNFVAFLNMLGVERLPGNPARAPLNFTLTQGSTSGGQVSAGTQVATVQTEEAVAIIFETEKSMFVTPAKIKKIYSVYPEQDKFGKHSALINVANSSAETIFSPDGKSDLEHSLYIGHDTLFAQKIPADITLWVETEKDVSIDDDLWNIDWIVHTKDGPRTLEDIEIEDTTNKLRSAAEDTDIDDTTNNVRFAADEKKYIRLKSISALAKSTVNEIESYWIQAKLSKPVPDVIDLPSIKSLNIAVNSVSSPPDVSLRQLDAAFFNTMPLDVSKDFFPFGETPKFNDTFYFASEEVFSQKGQEIFIAVELSGALVVPMPDPQDNEIMLVWEYYHQKKGETGDWRLLGESSFPSELPPLTSPCIFHDGTHAFTIDSKKGSICFTCPEHIARTEINGVENYWLRVRIVDGNYGKPASYELTSPPDGIVITDATYRPPSIKRFELSYQLTTPPNSVQHCVTWNNQTYVDYIKDEKLVTPFYPFKAIEDTEETLYLGFDNIENVFADNSISIFFAVKENLASANNQESVRTVAGLLSREPLILAWEYYNQSEKKWLRLEVEDGTKNFTTRGTAAFIGPNDFGKTTRLGKSFYWIRIRRIAGAYDVLPELKGVYLNTTWSKNTETIKEEIIGSSNGEKDQSFRFSRKPILRGEKIWIKELEIPSEDEKAMIEKEEKARLLSEESRKMTQADKDELIKVSKNDLTAEEEIWVRWHRVDNFLNSSVKSRHYVLDRIEGTIAFGDDETGMIPPVSKDNIQASYQSGGGSKANKVAIKNAIKELKSSLPYIDKVYNVEPASGGSDAETMEDTKDRGPQTIKNRDRAITVEDLEWLVRQASTQVVKSKCLPTTNKNLEFELGAITVIIVPESDDPQPQPTQELVQQVQSYLKKRGLSTIAGRIYVIGPCYVGISVSAEVVPLDRDQASVIEGRIVKNLESFLHPLSGGGAEGKGWDFGRNVYISEIYAVIEATEGVDYVEPDSVVLNNNASLEEVSVDDNSLVYSKPHDITMI